MQNTIWRVQTNRLDEHDHKYSLAPQFIERQIIGIGWHVDYQDSPILPGPYTDKAVYEQLAVQQHGTVPALVRNLWAIQPGDFIWLRDAGIYYLGLVTPESHWQYQATPATLTADYPNQLTDIDWQRVGDESAVPGKVTTAFIASRTLQRINDDNIRQFSQLKFKQRANFEMNEATFYSCLGSAQLEDLLALWLFVNKGYVVVPSTDKKSTELYECVLIDPKIPDKKIFIQVKLGQVDLNADDFRHLATDNNEVWLVSTAGIVRNIKKDDHIYPKMAVPDFVHALYEFAKTTAWLPAAIKDWFTLATTITD